MCARAQVEEAEHECERYRARVAELETRLSVRGAARRRVQGTLRACVIEDARAPPQTLATDAAAALSAREATRAAAVDSFVRRNAQLRIFIQKATA